MRGGRNLSVQTLRRDEPASIADPLPTGGLRNATKLSDEDLKSLLQTMMLIREFELRVTDLFREGIVKGTAHSSAGQEAIAAGACFSLQRTDFVATHHRGHGHCIAKGADVNRMMAELLGRSTGICGGLGGSMHVADIDLNIIGANGIVGASMGLGLAPPLPPSSGRPGTPASRSLATAAPTKESSTRRSIWPRSGSCR